MNNITSSIICQAISKLDSEFSGASLSKIGSAVGKSVVETLKDFCRQNDEFSQAVVQGKPVGECIEYTVKDAGSSISDIEVYRKAVEFYFPGAKVDFKMTVDLGDEGFSNSEPAENIDLSLDGLLDF